MRRIATAAILIIATVIGALTPAFGQRGGGGGGNDIPSLVSMRSGTAITPLGWYAMGSVACAAVAPMIGTVVLGREMTANEVGRSTLSCFLGPVGWWLGAELFPLEVIAPKRPPQRNPPPPAIRPARGRNVSIPPPGETRFVRNEVLLQVETGASAQLLDQIARSLQLTLLETQSFTLTGRTLQRRRIDGNRSVAATLRALSRYASIAAA